MKILNNTFLKSLYAFTFLLILPLIAFIPADDKITIFMIGDSTMADKPYENGNPEKGWGQVLPLYFKDGIIIENHAKNGRSSKSFRGEGLWKVVEESIQPGDYVIIQFGHNDQKEKSSDRYSAPETEYRQNLLRYIKEIRDKEGHPILATPIMRRRFDDDGKFYDTHGRYPEVVREVAQQEKVPLLDLHMKTRELIIAFGEERSKELFLHMPPGEYESFPEGKNDDTHLSPYGAFRICDLAIEEVKREVPEWIPFLKD